MLLEELFVLFSRSALYSILLFAFSFNEIKPFFVEWDHRERGPVLILFELLLELLSQLVFGSECVLEIPEVDAADDDVKSVVALFIGMNAVRKDGILLLSLICGRLPKCLVDWLRELIGEQVVVELQFAIVLEEFGLFVVEEAFFQPLDISVLELLHDFRVVDVDAVQFEGIEHIFILLDLNHILKPEFPSLECF